MDWRPVCATGLSNGGFFGTEWSRHWGRRPWGHGFTLKQREMSADLAFGGTLGSKRSAIIRVNGKLSGGV
jgi:hypothetical protein